MFTYRHFAVAGAGTIGKAVVEELIKKRDEAKILSISVLTRSPDSLEELREKGVKVVLVNYACPSSLQSALTGVDVVISTLSFLSIALQEPLARSAKAAGVKLFVPSDFEGHPNGETNFPLFKTKEVIKKRLKELELPYAIFCTGLFTDKVLSPVFAAALGLNFETGEFAIPGSGEAPISWTTSGEIAQIVAYALTTFSQDKLEWRTFRIEGDRISFNGITAQWEKRFRKSAIVFHRPRSVFKEAVNKNRTDFLSLFILELDAGHMAVGESTDLSSAGFLEWRPKKVIDVLDEMYGE